jgi:hypothetical protein
MKSLLQWFAESEGIEERLVKKVIVRRGKKQIVRRTDKEGYKTVNGKEVKMSSQEKMRKKKGAKRSAMKRKSKAGSMRVMRKKSMAKRKSLGK